MFVFYIEIKNVNIICNLKTFIRISLTANQYETKSWKQAKHSKN
jgi:hypothetical protein